MNSSSYQDSALVELLNIIWRGKWFVIAFCALSAIASVYYALSIPDKYRAVAQLSPVIDQSGNVLNSAQFAGIASLAGINIPAKASNNVELAIEVLRSRAFISDFIERHNLLVPLMAVAKWDISSGKFIYNNDIYNETNNEWVRIVKLPKRAIPSSQEAYETFIAQLDISRSRENSTLKVSFIHYSPFLASEIITNLVNDLNAHMRAIDRLEAEKNLAFLEGYLSKNPVEEVRRAIYQLMEEQTKTLMLTNVRQHYIFRVVDPAIPEEIRHSPKRAVICLAGVFFGFILSILTLVIRYFFKQIR